MLKLFDARRSLAANVVAEFGEDRVQTHVRGKYIHAKLYGAHQDYVLEHKQAHESASAHKRIDSTNIGTASMTFLYSDVSPEEGNLGDELAQETIDLFNPDIASKRTINVWDTFDADSTYEENVRTKTGLQACKSKRIRNRDFTRDIQTRIDNADPSLIIEKAYHAVSRAQAFAQNPMYAETFHHTEQAIMQTTLSMSFKDITGTSILKLAEANQADAGDYYGDYFVSKKSLPFKATETRLRNR